MSRNTAVAVIITALITLGAVMLAAVRNRPAGESAASAYLEPLSYAKPSACGQFMLVVFGNAADEEKLPAGDMKQKVQAARTEYPRPGLYAIRDKSKPLWEIDNQYAPDENIFVPAGGEVVIRLDGEWWKTKSYVAGQRERLAPAVEQAQLDAPAVSFLTMSGVRAYALKEIIHDKDRLPHSPEHIIWPGGAALNEQNGQFLLYTQDAHRVIFDARTGEVVSRGEVGFGSRFAQNTMMATVAMTVLLALGWATYAWKRRKPPEA